MNIALLIIGVILSVVGIFLFFTSIKIKIEKTELQEKYLKQI